MQNATDVQDSVGYLSTCNGIVHLFWREVYNRDRDYRNVGHREMRSGFRASCNESNLAGGGRHRRIAGSHFETGATVFSVLPAVSSKGTMAQKRNKKAQGRSGDSDGW